MQSKGIMSAPMLVSIHASVRDATEKAQQSNMDDYVSIHASVRDATNYIVLLFF